MKKNFRKALVICSLFAFAASFTSCNRGYGCPNNFSIGEKVSEIVKTAITKAIVTNQK
ncbi:MAG: hypothetical protein AAF849_16620 [Bacteroidota bacterium]